MPHMLRLGLLLGCLLPGAAWAQAPFPAAPSPTPTTVTLTQAQVAVPAGVSTLLLAANPSRRSLRISGSGSADSFRLGYGVAASATSSALFGSGGVFTAEQYGPGDGVPTGAIYAWSAAGFTAQVGEGD